MLAKVLRRGAVVIFGMLTPLIGVEGCSGEQFASDPASGGSAGAAGGAGSSGGEAGGCPALPCRNAGHCVAEAGATPRCECAPGFDGALNRKA